MDHGSINFLLFYAVIFLIIFLATLSDLAKEYQFRKIWLEYPVGLLHIDGGENI